MGGTAGLAPGAPDRLVGPLDSRVVDLAADEPEAYIARDRRQALADRIEMPDRVSGSARFASTRRAREPLVAPRCTGYG
jgi:hypothetical protein